MTTHRRWLTVETATTPAPIPFLHDLETLLDTLQPADLDSDRSTAASQWIGGNVVVQVHLIHASESTGDIHLNYLRSAHASPVGSTLHGVTGITEYYGDHHDGPLERALLADLADLLTASYDITETPWHSYQLSTSTRRTNRGTLPAAVQGWLPPRWLIPGSQLLQRCWKVSFHWRPRLAAPTAGRQANEARTAPTAQGLPVRIGDIAADPG